MKKPTKTPVKKATMKPLKKKVSARIASKPSVTKAKGILKAAVKTANKRTLSENATAKFDFEKMIDAYEEMKDDIIDSISDIVENSILAIKPKASKSKSASATAIADLSNPLLIAEKNSAKVMEKLDDIQTSVSKIKVPKPSRTFDKKENSDTIAKGLEQALISLSKKKVTKTRVAAALLDELSLTGVAGTNSFVDSSDAPYWPANQPRKSRARRPIPQRTKKRQRQTNSFEDADFLNLVGYGAAKVLRGGRKHNVSSFAGEYASSGFVEGDLEVQRDVDSDIEGADLINLAAWKARKTIQKLKMKRVRKTQLEAASDKVMDLKAEDLIMNARKKRLGLGAGAAALWQNAPGGPAGFDLTDLVTAGAAGAGFGATALATLKKFGSKVKSFVTSPWMLAAASATSLATYGNRNIKITPEMQKKFEEFAGPKPKSGNNKLQIGNILSSGIPKNLFPVTPEMQKKFEEFHKNQPNILPNLTGTYPPLKDRGPSHRSRLPGPKAPISPLVTSPIKVDGHYPPLAGHGPRNRSRLPASRQPLSPLVTSPIKVDGHYPPLAGHGPRNRSPLPILQGTAVVAEAQKMKGMGVSISRVRELIYLGGELAKVQSKIKRLTAGSKDDTSLDMILNPLKDKEHQLIERILELKGKIAGRKVSENDSITGSSESQILKGSRGHDVLSRPTVFELPPDPVVSQRFGQRFGGASMPYGTYMANGSRTASLGPVGGRESGGGRSSYGPGYSSGDGGGSVSETATPSGFSNLGNLTPEQEQEALAQGVVRNGPQGGALGPALLPGQGITLTEKKQEAIKVGKDGKAAAAMRYFMGKGWTKEQAAGIVGNLQQESGVTLNTKAKGDKSIPGASIGIGQWNRERQAALRKFAKDRNKDVYDFETQLEFVNHELNGTEKGAGGRLKKAKTVEEATAAMIGYERPQGWKQDNPRGGHGWNNRLNNANALYKQDLNTETNSTKETKPTVNDSTFSPKPDYTKEATKSEKSAAVTSTADDKKRGRFDDKYYESILKKYDAHPDRKGSISNLDSETKARLGAMFRDAPESVKKELRINSAFRDKALQASLYNASGGSGMVAKNSQHSQGRAIDLGSAGSGRMGGGWNKLSPETKKWVTENAQKYGLYTPLQPKYGTRIKEDWHFEPIGNRGDWKGQPKQPKANLSDWKDPALAKNTVMETIDTSQEKADMKGVPLKNRTIGSIRKETFGMKEEIREDRMPSVPMKPPVAKAIEPVAPARMEDVKPPAAPIHPEVKGKPFTATSAPVNRGSSTDFPVMGNDIMPPSYRKATTKAKNKPTNEAPTNSQGLTSPWFI